LRLWQRHARAVEVAGWIDARGELVVDLDELGAGVLEGAELRCEDLDALAPFRDPRCGRVTCGFDRGAQLGDARMQPCGLLLLFTRVRVGFTEVPGFDSRLARFVLASEQDVDVCELGRLGTEVL